MALADRPATQSDAKLLADSTQLVRNLIFLSCKLAVSTDCGASATRLSDIGRLQHACAGTILSQLIGRDATDAEIKATPVNSYTMPRRKTHKLDYPLRDGGPVHYYRPCVTYGAERGVRPFRITVHAENKIGQTISIVQLELTALEATELCDMLADCIGRNTNTPADF